jgi:hypothetical protein
MIAQPAETRGSGGLKLGLPLALAVLCSTACDGTKQPIFAPLKVNVAGAPGPAIHDAAVGPVVDAGGSGHPSVKPPHHDAGMADEDAGGPPDPDDLDPNVTFVWTETQPGDGTCHAGVYTGSFDCEIPSDPTTIGGLPVSLSGQIVFTLASSPEEQQLMITDGSISSGLLLTSGMQGKLYCSDNMFSAESVDGTALTVGDMNTPFFFGSATFDAMLMGTYDNDTLVISGMFTMFNEQRDMMCTGTFRVSATP